MEITSLNKIFVYADNAATTKLAPEALSAMLPFLEASYGNPSSIYTLGRQARTAVDESRGKVADAIGAISPKEIIFTSSGTEADNLAITGVARNLAAQGKKHIIISAVEHPAVLKCAEALEAEGVEVTRVPVDINGRVNPDCVLSALRANTSLVSIMYANNETGVIQPVAKIGAICRNRGVLFHTDAVQAIGSIPVDVEADNIDLLSLSAHKFKGPKGVGALYIREGVSLLPHTYGGGQEFSIRAGTENIAGIVGLAAAIQIKPNSEKVRKLRDKLLKRLLQIPGTTLNGDYKNRLAGNINLSFDDVYGESLLLMLDLYGIAASSGSACSAGTHSPSHVLLSMGLSPERASSAVRLTINESNTISDIDYIAVSMPEIVEKVRGMC
jgi:cysteine desulfurase